MAFGCFKLAVVLEGIHARFLQNKTVGEGFQKEGPAGLVAHPARAPAARRGCLTPGRETGWGQRAEPGP